MTLFGELHFFLLAAVLMIPALILGINEKPLRFYGFAVTIVFVFLAADSWRQLAWTAVYFALELGLVKGLLALKRRAEENGGRESKALFRLMLLASLTPLIAAKLGGLFGESIFAFVGLSYLTFRTAQVMIEIRDGLIDEVGTFDFAYFLFFFPCLSSGPIDRSRRFVQDAREIKPRAEYLEMVGNGLMEICQGLVYKFVLSSAFFQGMTYLGEDIGEWTGSGLIYTYCYGLYLFFDFAGYSKMAVGAGAFLGIRVPQNFNKPFLSVDIKEFWDRWHITLSHWFRDFVFSRFMMAAIRGKWFKNKLTGACVGFMLNMGLMGLWHGLSLNYIIYGLYHGVLLSLTEVYQKKSGFYKKNKKKLWYRIGGMILTFHLAAFGFLIFSGKLIN